MTFLSISIVIFLLIYIVPIAGIAMDYIFYRLLKKERVREKYDRMLLKLPLLGKSIRTVNSARFARTFGILSAATVPVLESHASRKGD